MAVTGSGSSSFRVLLAISPGIVAECLAECLRRAGDLDVVGIVRSGPDLAEEAPRVRPDVVVFDPRLPGLDTPVLEEIRGQEASPPLLALELDHDESRSWDLLRRGASGYLDGGATLRELFQAIEAVGRGECFLSSRATRGVIERMSRPGRRGGAPFELTARERQILHLVADGLSSREIATRLRLSARTVEAHRVQLMAKLRAGNSAHLVRLAIREGLIGT